MSPSPAPPSPAPSPALDTGPTPLIVWLVDDGKPGHVNQSMGLAEAFARATPSVLYRLPVLSRATAWLSLALQRDPAPHLPAPHWILGAGHATHATMLAARRARGGRAVVLMKPSLPRSCFDYCVVPAHDRIAADARTLVTTGALNRIVASQIEAGHIEPGQIEAGQTAGPARGLILLGGESRHFDWHNEAIWLQVKSLVSRSPHTHWTLTTSRRTPNDFLAGLAAAPNLQTVPHTVTDADWLPAQLAHASVAWVSPDSASMVYEALTAGCRVGVFDLPVNPVSRVGWAIAELADARRITRFISWAAHGTLHPNTTPLAEADRCAAWLLSRP